MQKPVVTPDRARHRAALLGAMLLAAQPIASVAQDLPELVLEAMERRALGLDATDLYLKIATMPVGPLAELPAEMAGPCSGGKICQGVDVEHVALPDGGPTIAAERPLSPMELGILVGNVSPPFLRAMGNGMITAQVQLNEVLGFGPTDEASLALTLGSMDPLAMASTEALPLLMTQSLGIFGFAALEAADAADVASDQIANRAALAKAELDRALDIYRQAEFGGTDNVGDIAAYLFRFTGSLPVPDSGVPGGPEDAQFTDASIWIDPENLRFLKQRIEGTMTAEDETRDFYIEIEFSDFRTPPGCGTMDQPFRRTTRMGGMLNDAEMAEMAEAQAALAEFEAEMAAMPEDQRRMVERMMGSQMETMRNLVNSGNFEYVEQTEQIICNPDLATLFRLGPEADGDEDLIRMIQEYLVILGYEPGNIDGLLDPLTEVAISQFQAEQGLPVTGAPSPALLSRLEAALGV